MLSLFKKIILLSLVFTAGTSFACSPPAITPDKWDYYADADIVFVGDVSNSKMGKDFLETRVYPELFPKNPLGINLRKDSVTIFSEKNSALCGFDQPFGIGDGIIVFGKVDSDGEIFIDSLSGTITFDRLQGAIDYFNENYVNDTCEGSYVGYSYDSNSDTCFESRVPGCNKKFSETFLETRSACETAFVKNEIEDTCNDDVLQCQNGVTLERIPPSCAFPKCEQYVPPVIDPNPWDGKILCTRDLKKCPDGTYVSRVGSACEFAACPFYSEPSTCNNDRKVCPDGSTVKRTGAFCNFEECGTVKPVDTGEKRCDVVWTGYKFDQEKGICLETNVKGCENTLFETRMECQTQNDTTETGIKDDTFTDCSLEYVPVCGKINDTQDTYTNACLMSQAGAELVGEGTCKQLNSIYTKIVNWFFSLFK